MQAVFLELGDLHDGRSTLCQLEQSDTIRFDGSLGIFIRYWISRVFLFRRMCLWCLWWSSAEKLHEGQYRWLIVQPKVKQADGPRRMPPMTSAITRGWRRRER